MTIIIPNWAIIVICSLWGFGILARLLDSLLVTILKKIIEDAEAKKKQS